MGAREDKDNFLIVARTDSRASLGVEEAMRRMEAYARAGADILFFDRSPKGRCGAPARAFYLPMLANIANGGKTPILPARTLEEIGYALAVYPSMTSLVAAAAMERAFETLKTEGLSEELPLFDFNEFCRLMSFEDVWNFEKRRAR